MHPRLPPPPRLGALSKPATFAGLPWYAWAIGATGAAAAGIHGYRRHSGDAGLTALWTVLGFVMPLPAVVIAGMQGYGKRA